MLNVSKFDSDDFRQELKKQRDIAPKNSGDGNNLTVGNEESGMGEAGTINPDMEAVWDVLSQLIIPKSHAFDIGPVNIQIEFIFNPYKGTIRFSVGFSMGIDIAEKVTEAKDKKKKQIDTKKEYKAKRKQEVEAIENNLVNIQKQIIQNNDEINKLKKEGKAYTEKYKELEKAKEDTQAAYDKKWTDYKNNGGTLVCRKEKDAAKAASKEYTKFEKQYQKAQAENINAIKNTKLDNKNAVDFLKDFLKNGKGLKQKSATIKDFFKKPAAAAGSGKIGLDLDFTLTGYLEFSYRDRVIVDAGLYGEIEIKFSYTYQTFLPIGPIVIPFYVKGELSGGVKFNFITHKIDTPFKPANFADWFKNIEVIFTIGLRLEAGVGLAGIASVGGYGKGKFEFGVNLDKFGSFEWGAGVKVQFLFYEGEWGYDSDKIYFYGDPNTNKLSVDSLNIMHRMLSKNLNATESQVFDGIYQLSQPKLLPLGKDKQILFWLDDDETKDDFNRASLKYAILKDGKWSESQNVSANGLTDFSYDVSLYNGDVYVAVQKASRKLDVNDNPTTILRDTEIFTYKLNLNSLCFENEQRLSNDSFMDANPKFCATDGDLVLAWSNNSKNDYFGITGKNALYISTLIDGEFKNITKIYEEEKLINNFNIAKIGSDILVAVQEDADNDLLTDNSYVRIICKGSDDKIIENAYNPQFYNDCGIIGLAFFQGGNIISTKDFNNIEKIAASFSPFFTITSINNRATVFYESGVDGVDQVFCAYLNKSKWVSGIQVSSETADENDLFSSTGFVADGKIFVSYNVQNKNDYLAVCYTEREFKYNYEIDGYLFKNAENAKNTVKMMIYNTGNIEIDSFTVEIAGYQTKIECLPALIIGEKRYYDIDFSMPSDSKSIKIKVYISDEKDAILVMRTLELQVAYTDFNVAFNRQIVNTKQHFFIHITNKTKTSESGNLLIYVNELCVKEISVTLSSEASENIDLILDELQLNDFIYLVFIADNSEYDISDNYHGYYSLQNEKITNSMINPYATVLNKALRR